MIKNLQEVLESRGEPEGRNPNNRNYFRRGDYKAIMNELGMVNIYRQHQVICVYTPSDKSFVVDDNGNSGKSMTKALEQCREWCTAQGYKEFKFELVYGGETYDL